MILKNVLEVAYLGNVGDEQDVKAFRTLARWIYKGLSKQDNQPIDALFLKHFPPKAVGTREQIQHTKFPSDHLLSGLPDGVMRYCWRLKSRKVRGISGPYMTNASIQIYNKVQMLLSDEGPVANSATKAMPTEFRFPRPIKERRLTENIDNCVKNEVMFLEENQLLPERY